MKTLHEHAPHGAGLGLRRALMSPFMSTLPQTVDFLEVAPENWIKLGGRFAKQFKELTEQYRFVLHGLSLSIGSPDPLDIQLVHDIKDFMDKYGIEVYTEHLSYCSEQGHLYDLLPIPFCEEAVHYVAGRIRQVQDILGCQIAMENASYYAVPQPSEMSEAEFINAVITEANCGLLLDVNNIYVNSINHGYDPVEFLKQMPAEKIVYLHIAGHYNEAKDLIVDTHGADVIDPVWDLLEKTYQHCGVLPTLLERDFNLPPLEELLKEVEVIRNHQKHYAYQAEQAVYS